MVEVSSLSVGWSAYYSRIQTRDLASPYLNALQKPVGCQDTGSLTLDLLE